MPCVDSSRIYYKVLGRSFGSRHDIQKQSQNSTSKWVFMHIHKDCIYQQLTTLNCISLLSHIICYESWTNIFINSTLKKNSYLALLGLSCGTQDLDLCCGMQVLLLWHVGTSSLTRDKTQSPALATWSLSHWTTRLSPKLYLLNNMICTPYYILFRN